MVDYTQNLTSYAYLTLTTCFPCTTYNIVCWNHHVPTALCLFCTTRCLFVLQQMYGLTSETKHCFLYIHIITTKPTCRWVRLLGNKVDALDWFYQILGNHTSMFLWNLWWLWYQWWRHCLLKAAPHNRITYVHHKCLDISLKALLSEHMFYLLLIASAHYTQ